jgi:SAM-dependent methyltransferase
LTVIVTASLIASHPRLDIIAATLDSLDLLELPKETKIVLAHDWLNPADDTSENRARYEQYLSALANHRAASERNLEIVARMEWGHLPGSLSEAFRCVSTEFVLVMQHDLPFVRRINLLELMALMRLHGGVRHIRFNKRRNVLAGSDALDDDFRAFFSECGFDVGGAHVSLTRTLCWSDNNHLTTRKHYEETVFPDCGGRKLPMEAVLMGKKDHARYGTYISGGLGEPPAIAHLHGRLAAENSLAERIADSKTRLEWPGLARLERLKLSYSDDVRGRRADQGWIGISSEKADGKHVLHDYGEPLPLPDESVDAFLLDVGLIYLRPAVLLDVVFPEVHRTLKPGGYARIALPDYRSNVFHGRSLKDESGRVYHDPGAGGYWDGKRMVVQSGGAVWFPVYETLKALIELSPLGHCQAEWLHYHDAEGRPTLNDIDYSKGFIPRTPDHDARARNPRRPLSLVVDLVKARG